MLQAQISAANKQFHQNFIAKGLHLRQSIGVQLWLSGCENPKRLNLSSQVVVIALVNTCRAGQGSVISLSTTLMILRHPTEDLTEHVLNQHNLRLITSGTLTTIIELLDDYLALTLCKCIKRHKHIFYFSFKSVRGTAGYVPCSVSSERARKLPAVMNVW